LGIALGGSRAGMMGALLACLLGGVVAYSAADTKPRVKLLILASLPVGLSVLGMILPSIAIGQRVLGTVGMSASPTALAAAGTSKARTEAWSVLLDYASASHSRTVAGVGFGVNFMGDSGAGVRLYGSSDVGPTLPRSPHNYWLNTLLRVGLVGLALFVALLSTVSVRLALYRAELARSHLLRLAALLLVSLIPPMTLGVVLESPFGAVPFFWCMGVVVSAHAILDSEC
jgi:O-antigen ligase